MMFFGHIYHKTWPILIEFGIQYP